MRGTPVLRVRLVAPAEQLEAEVALLREELRINGVRLRPILPVRRLHYPPAERMAILQPKAARAWSATDVARRFLLTSVTSAA